MLRINRHRERRAFPYKPRFYHPDGEKRGETVEERLTFVRSRPQQKSQLPLLVGFLLLVILMLYLFFPEIFSAMIPVGEFQLDSLNRIQ